MRYIEKEFDIKYVVQNKFIVGIIWKDRLILTPHFYWVFEEQDSPIPLFKALESIKQNKLKLPSIQAFNKDYITNLYRDYEDRKIHMITYLNTAVIVEPFEVSAAWSNNYNIMTFDYNAIFINLYNLNISKDNFTLTQQTKILNIADILNNYIYIQIMNTDLLDVNMLLKDLRFRNVVYTGETFINYADKNKNFVSWRSSKINEKDFNEYFSKYANTQVNDIIKTIYNKFHDEMNFKVGNDETIVSKIITV